MPPNDRRQRLLAKFRQVTADRIARFHAGLDQVCDERTSPDFVVSLKRDLHTIKGEAKLMKFSLASDVAHRVEDFLNPALDRGQVGFVRDLATEGLDLISDLVENNEPYPDTLVARVNVFLATPIPAGDSFASQET